MTDFTATLLARIFSFLGRLKFSDSHENLRFSTCSLKNQRLFTPKQYRKYRARDPEAPEIEKELFFLK
jgi:hypothetical protein